MEFSSKINKLLQLQPPGTVFTSSWLNRRGYSNELLQKYRSGKWLTAIGSGAMARYNDPIDYLGALYAIQNQLHLSVHPAGKTALLLAGKAHFMEFNATKVYLFGGDNEQLPAWFKKKDWGVEIQYKSSSFLPKNLGMMNYEHKNFSIQIASPARALMECLYLTPDNQDLVECYELMKGLTNITPKTTQALLEHCSSVKVNRLFLYLAEKANHGWFSHLQLNQIALGGGKRSFAKSGVYINKYKMTVPRALVQNELPEL
ncbi:MAG: hypothetical protein COZ75_02840 [Flavobacteriaceae bacterium CG_4_8_14_3_um_filter_34_10]|nr:MAG: hypothetical protein COS19_02800 [Flavobacteriaceae bacterium CG02_land_8_20_14_3_00_34_13]PIX10189.1 MAG: hypothetical protein COZ75_02840 [Flavobacteriaceae bacterium CG_4_8_14_3_um_filter_34_10]